ncbi:MAG: hypothetical protein S4CHLAM37_13740 [Chlamydiia bacterium]|nr:hypothetical protein [Chlamydiia bacterium]
MRVTFSPNTTTREFDKHEYFQPVDESAPRPDRDSPEAFRDITTPTKGSILVARKTPEHLNKIAEDLGVVNTADGDLEFNSTVLVQLLTNVTSLFSRLERDKADAESEHIAEERIQTEIDPHLDRARELKETISTLYEDTKAKIEASRPKASGFKKGHRRRSSDALPGFFIQRSSRSRSCPTLALDSLGEEQSESPSAVTSPRASRVSKAPSFRMPPRSSLREDEEDTPEARCAGLNTHRLGALKEEPSNGKDPAIHSAPRRSRVSRAPLHSRPLEALGEVDESEAPTPPVRRVSSAPTFNLSSLAEALDEEGRP